MIARRDEQARSVLMVDKILADAASLARWSLDGNMNSRGRVRWKGWGEWEAQVHRKYYAPTGRVESIGGCLMNACMGCVVVG